MGFPGVLLYTALFVYLLRECFRIWKSFGPDNQFEKNFCLCSLGLVLVSIIEAMSGDLRFNPTLNSLTFLFVGIAVSMKSWQKMQRSRQKIAVTRGAAVPEAAESSVVVDHVGESL